MSLWDHLPVLVVIVPLLAGPLCVLVERPRADQRFEHTPVGLLQIDAATEVEQVAADQGADGALVVAEGSDATLGLATLGYASVPGPPLNAAIALSILFLGPEMVRVWRGETSFTIRHPWVVAFLFGLLHGFGFASGLSTVGMPRAEVPLALAMFNVGVELGQLVFVALVLLLYRSLRTLEFRCSRLAELGPAYVVGSLGAYWTIQRTAMIF